MKEKYFQRTSIDLTKVFVGYLQSFFVMSLNILNQMFYEYNDPIYLRNGIFTKIIALASIHGLIFYQLHIQTSLIIPIINLNIGPHVTTKMYASEGNPGFKVCWFFGFRNKVRIEKSGIQ